MSESQRSKSRSEHSPPPPDSSGSSSHGDETRSERTKDSTRRKFRFLGRSRRTLSPESEEPNQPEKRASVRKKMIPWKDKVSNHLVSPEQEERYVNTGERVKEVSRSILGYGSNVAQDALRIGSNILAFPPVNPLGAAARTVLYIWDALERVESNQLACLSITERCVDTLVILKDEIIKAGNNIESHLEFPMMQLNDSFDAVRKLVEKQARRPFYKRYLKRKEIQKEIESCDSQLSNALELFSLKIQIRSLQQMEEAEARRRAGEVRTRQDLQKLLDFLPEKVKKQERLALSQIASISDIARTEREERRRISEQPTDVEKSLPTTSEIRRKVDDLILNTNNWDFALDLAELRRMMRDSLEYSSDDALRDLLQVEREKVHTVLKELQHVLKNLNVDDVDDSVADTMETTYDDLNQLGEHIMTISRASTMPIKLYQIEISDGLDKAFIKHSIKALKRAKTA